MQLQANITCEMPCFDMISCEMEKVNLFCRHRAPKKMKTLEASLKEIII